MSWRRQRGLVWERTTEVANFRKSYVLAALSGDARMVTSECTQHSFSAVLANMGKQSPAVEPLSRPCFRGFILTSVGSHWDKKPHNKSRRTKLKQD